MPVNPTAIIRVDGVSPGGDFPPNGDIVVARVIKRVGEGLFRISLRGKTMTARSELPLVPGETLKARLEAIPGGRRLKILSRRGPSGDALPVPRSPTTPKSMLSEALLRSGLPVPKEAELQRKSALLGRTRGNLRRLSRLFAELNAKGVDPSADFLERLDDLFDVGRRKDGNKGRQPPRRWLRPPGKENLPSDLAEDTAKLPDELRLLNAAGGVRGRWAFLPFSRTVGERAWRGLIKLRVEGDPALTLSLDDGTNTWEFIIEGRPTRLTTYARHPEKVLPESMNILRNRLSALNILADGSILPLEESDGFPSATGSNFGPVEEQA